VFEPDETFFVNLTNASNASIGDDQGVGTIRDDDYLPRIRINDVSIAEGNAGTTNLVFSLTLSHPATQAVMVDFVTYSFSSPGHATPDVDYTSVNATVTFDPLVTSVPVTVLITGETIFEGNEEFYVDLTNPRNAAIERSFAIATILNDDPRPTISIHDVALPEGSTGTTNFSFDVTLSNPSATAIYVDFATVEGTALEIADYVVNAGVLTFDPLVTVQQATIAVVGDEVVEPNETFFVRLNNAIGATMGDREGVGTIINDDVMDADISVLKMGPEFAPPGAPINYAIIVKNSGPQAATGVTLADTIPVSTNFVSASPSQGTCSGTAAVLCVLGTIGVGWSATINIAVNAPVTEGPVTNSASATAIETDHSPGNNTSTVVTRVIRASNVPAASVWTLLILVIALAAFATIRLPGIDAGP
jgi:uncharacterized repeat protein (TIGR01451 family)